MKNSLFPALVCIMLIVIVMQIGKQPAKQVQPPITIMTVEFTKSFFDNDVVYIDYLVGVEPTTITVKSLEQAEQFIARLAEMADVVRMDK